MKLADYNFEQDYATCDGHRVRLLKTTDSPDEKVVYRRRFYIRPVVDPKDHSKKFTDPKKKPTSWTTEDQEYAEVFLTDAESADKAEEVKTDPWGPCHINKKNVTITDGVIWDDERGCWVRLTRGHGTRGIAAQVFEVDHNGDILIDVDGKEVSRGFSLYAPKSIPGTWLEYLSLHAEDVKAKGLQQARLGLETNINQISKRLGRDIDISTSTWRSSRRVRNGDKRDEVYLSVRLDGQAALDYLSKVKDKDLRAIVSGAEVDGPDLLVRATLPS